MVGNKPMESLEKMGGQKLCHTLRGVGALDYIGAHGQQMAASC